MTRKIASLLFFLIVTNVSYGEFNTTTNDIEFVDNVAHNDSILLTDEQKAYNERQAQTDERIRRAKEDIDMELVLINTVWIILGIVFFRWWYFSSMKNTEKRDEKLKWEASIKRMQEKKKNEEISLKRKEKENEKKIIEEQKTAKKESSPNIKEQINAKVEYKGYEVEIAEEVRKIGIKHLKSKNKPEEIISENGIFETKEIEFVDYQISQFDNTENFPVLKTPAKGCVIRTHRYGKSKRRGYKEEAFQKSVQIHFGLLFQISGDIRLNTGKNTRPFEPDIAIIGKNTYKNIRIDIEVDEPYSGRNRQPTHCKGEDEMRDIYFTDRGWIVVRFSEYQIHTQELACLKYIANVIKQISQNYAIPYQLKSGQILEKEKLWDIIQAQKWEKEKYREKYLGIDDFGIVKNNKEAIERDFSEQEFEEEQLVKSTIIGVSDTDEKCGFNKINYKERDERITFYPEKHIYTIDNISVPSVTTIINKFFPVFDTEKWSKKKSFEYGLSPKDLALQWEIKGKTAKEKGTHLHEQIEKYYLQQAYQQTEEFYLFEQFAKEHSHLELYRSEWRIFDEDLNIAGTIDLIAENNGAFEIYDWKRSEKVVSENGIPKTENRWQCGIGELQDIPDTSYNRYSLQQSMYRYILERKYNLKISKMYLIVLHPNYEQYYKIETPYLKEKVEYMLKNS